MSSATADYIYPYVSVYGGTKSFINNFSINLGNELIQDNIDVISVKPLGVSTRIIGNIKGPWIIEP